MVKSENHSLKWDGTKYDIIRWNVDQTLQTAVSNSVVWYFQHFAAQVGEERMKQILGWFVGYVAQPERICVFATNIQANDNASGIKAREFIEKILRETELL